MAGTLRRHLRRGGTGKGMAMALGAGATSRRNLSSRSWIIARIAALPANSASIGTGESSTASCERRALQR